MRQIWAVSLMAGLMACSTPSEEPAPTSSGVGFGNYGEYLQRLIEQERAEKQAASVAPGPRISEESTAPAPTPTAVVRPAPEPEAPVAPVVAAAEAPPPPAPAGSSEVDDENSFEQVTAERTIQDDAALLERNRALYVIIEPTDLPKRPGSNVPNIVAYALATNNPLGVPLYQRGPFGSDRAAQRACARYVSDDLAQEAFLSSGGPKRDPKKLDPDGDGFACKWDPAPFRAVRN